MNPKRLSEGRKTRSGASLATSFTPEDDDTVPATPDTDAGSSGSFIVPKNITESRRATNRPPISARRQNLPATWRSPHFAREKLEERGTPTESNPSADRAFASSIPEGPGVAATPPIAENDLEPVGPFSPSGPSFSQPARPSPLDTVAGQDASLPSPSLSPITAAATLAQHSDLLFPGVDGDSDSSTLASHDHSRSDRSRNRWFGDAMSAPISQEGGDTGLSDGGSFELPPPGMGIPAMLHSFDALPDKMKEYMMFQFLRRCKKQTLHFVANVVNPALKCDFLDLLPLELSLNILQHLDVKSMCNAAQVSKKWRHIIDTNETAWKDLLEADGYELPPGELERAVEEGWGWQYPHSRESWERDLRSPAIPVKADVEQSDSSPFVRTSSLLVDSDVMSLRPTSSRAAKRKYPSKHGFSVKKSRKKAPSSSKSLPAPFSKSHLLNQGPIRLAEYAAAAIPSPNIGLPSLRTMHLYKSLYQRHHLIRKSWMDEDTRPKHIAFRAHQRHVVTCLQFDTDKILTGSDDTNIHVYDTKTGALRRRLLGHEGGVWALQYEGNTLVSGSTDRSVRVWDIETGKCTAIFHGHTSTVRCLVILKPTQIGETSDGQPIMMPKEPLIITGSRDSSLRVWKLPPPNAGTTGVGEGPYVDYDSLYFVRVLNGHHHSVRAIAAHGDTLVSGSYDYTVRVWKISTGETLHRLQGHTQKVYSVVLDHARNRCISGSMDTLVKVWSLETGQCLFNLEGHTSLVGLLDLSHERLVSAAADSTLRIWDPENGSCKSTLCAHTGAITCFQHDGQKVISGSDCTLKMWNVKTGKLVKDLLTDLSGVWQVKFNERRCVAAVQRKNMTYIEVGFHREFMPSLGVS